MNREFLEELFKVLPKERVLLEEPMRHHTTFRVGGEADYFLMPSSEAEVYGIIKLLKRYGVPFLTVGNGSNLLVGDGGFEGAILHLGKNFSRIDRMDEEDGKVTLHVQAGALLSGIAGYAREHALVGFEFAAGIPGSLGGAVVMNAGAYGGEISQVVESVRVLEPDGGQRCLPKDKMNFSYRHSILQDREVIALSADIVLQKGDKEEITARMKELAARRKEKQPLEYPSAGSTFKRPEGHFAGKLIMDAGLGGFQIGGAQVSRKHCGFVINTGDACARDVAAVIRHVQDTVMEKYAVMLEPEVRFAGRFD